MKKIYILAEIAAMFALCMVKIWIIREDFILLIILFLISISWMLNGETPKTLGFLPSVRLTDNRVQITSVAIITALCFVPFMENYDAIQAGMRKTWDFIFHQYGWALLQQTLISGYFALRLNEALQNRRQASFATGILFGVGHFPNAFLMLAAFLGGMIFSAIFLKRRSIHEVSALHAISSAILYHSIPSSIHHGFVVGPKLFN